MTPRTLVAALALITLATAALAQQPDPRATRERELLRRSQAALQEANAQRDALQAEKTTLQAEHDRLKLQTERDAAELRALRADVARFKGDGERGQQALADARRESSALQKAGSEREATLQQRLAEAQRELAARTQANQQVAALLEKASTRLATAEERNAGLHALAHEMVNRWLDKSATDVLLQREPLLGLREVAMQDTAETLRARINALQLPPRQP
jgi:siderophore synthetase component